MLLKRLIEILENEDENTTLKEGFNSPHSYRGYYSELAFEPAKDITIGEMLKSAKSSINETFGAWGGGDYKMTEFTDVYLANMGETGEEITELAMKYLLSKDNTL